MVACLAGPGVEEDILLLDCDFLMSSFGEGLLALCTKRCLTQQPGDGLKGKTRIPLSHPVMSLTATCVRTDTIVRHHKDLARPHASHWTLATADCRLPKYRISLVHSISLVGARYKHSRVRKEYTSTDRRLSQDKYRMLIISSGQTQQMNTRKQGLGSLYNVSPE